MSVSNYRSDHAALIERVQREEQEAMAAKSWLEFIQRHPEVRMGGMANRGIFQEYFATDYPAGFTVQSLEEAYANPTLRKQLALDDAEGSGEREKLLKEYAALLTGSPEAIRSAIEASKYLTNEQLREKVVALRLKREMQPKSPAELRKVIADNTPAPEQDDLPPQHTRASLLAMTGPELRKIISRFGLAATTRRLNQR